MTIDLRKRLEELERENADLRERLRCEREAQHFKGVLMSTELPARKPLWDRAREMFGWN